ncbi:MAG: hypothetical protein ACYCS1_02075 [Gammaproteobacteria bacterium]
MSKPCEHKTVLSYILACVQEIGWRSVPQAEGFYATIAVRIRART